MQEFLVIQTAFIGDAVLATGVLEKLHESFPNAHIDFLVRKGNESLFLDHPFIRKVLIWDKKANKYKQLLKMLSVIRKQHYDVVINVQRYAATGILTTFSGADYTVGFHKNPLSFFFNKRVKHKTGNITDTIHEIERNHSLISHFVEGNATKPKLYPRKEDVEAVELYQQKPYVCVAPASVWFTKQFPTHKWVELIQHIPQNISVYLLGAPSDEGLCSEIISLSNRDNNSINLAGKLSFLQSAALMKTAKMNFVNDSAPMHFASSVDAPVTAVYCSTIPAFGYGPLSSKSYIVETKMKLTCRPCGIHGKVTCPLKHYDCANSIEVEQLLENIYK